MSTLHFGQWGPYISLLFTKKKLQIYLKHFACLTNFEKKMHFLSNKKYIHPYYLVTWYVWCSPSFAIQNDWNKKTILFHLIFLTKRASLTLYILEHQIWAQDKGEEWACYQNNSINFVQTLYFHISNLKLNWSSWW